MDDDADICGLMRRILERASFVVDTATRTADALDRLDRGDRLDLLLLDLRLDQGYDGLTLGSVSAGLLPEARILYVSGGDPPPFTADFRREDFLPKPISAADLQRRALTRFRGGR